MNIFKSGDKIRVNEPLIGVHNRSGIVLNQSETAQWKVQVEGNGLRYLYPHQMILIVEKSIAIKPISDLSIDIYE